MDGREKDVQNIQRHEAYLETWKLYEMFTTEPGDIF